MTVTGVTICHTSIILKEKKNIIRMKKRIVMAQIVYNTLYNCNLSKVSITVICLYFILSHFLFYINYFSIQYL